MNARWQPGMIKLFFPTPATLVLCTVLAGAAGLLPGAAHAQQTGAERLPLWEVGIVGGSLFAPAYPGADDRSSRTLALPYVIYRGEVLRSDRSGIGARLLRTDRVEFDVGFAASLPAYSDDVAARAGMPDLGTLIEFGPRVKVRLAKPTPWSQLRLEAPLRTVIEVRGGLNRHGWTFEPRLVYETRAVPDLDLDFTLGLVMGERDISRYFYEVEPRFATQDRPAYRARGGLMLVRAGVFASYKFNPDLSLFGFVRYESYAGAANRDSPLMKRDNGASAGVGFAWTLRRSKKLASPEALRSFESPPE